MRCRPLMHRALPARATGSSSVHTPHPLLPCGMLRLDPAGVQKSAKSSRLDGVLPSHGDQAIYDALVRLAQDFSSRFR